MKFLFLVKEIEVEHLGIMYMASLLEQAGHQVRAADARDFKGICRLMREDEYPVVASSVTGALSGYYKDVYARLRQRFDFTSLWGGPLPTFYPQIINDPAVDMICQGEGEYPLLEIAERMEKGLPLNDIKNIWLKSKGIIVKNPLRSPVKDLDSLPFPKRDIFSTKKIRQYKASVIASRGCAYSCPYCCASESNNQQVHGSAYFRTRSVENVIAELTRIRSAGYRFVLFEDSSLAFSEQWLEDFSREYSQRIKLPFYCNVRAEQINEKTAYLLKAADCHSVSLGVETASDFIRNNVLCRRTSKQQIINAVGLLRKHDMKVKLTNMLGLPCGDMGDDIETLILNRRLRPDYAKTGALSLFEGTKMLEHLENNENSSGLIREWKEYRHKNKDKIQALRYLFGIFTEIHLPVWLLRFLVNCSFNRLYRLLYYCWDGYCSHFRIFRTGWPDFKRGLIRYFKLLRTE